jgi:putative transcriptional regulator
MKGINRDKRGDNAIQTVYFLAVSKEGAKEVIRFRLKELIADREFSTGRRVTFEEIAKQTGIHRTTLSKIAGQRGYNTTTDNIDSLCRFFSCPVERLMEYVADEV